MTEQNDTLQTLRALFKNHVIDEVGRCSSLSVLFSSGFKY